MAAYSLRLSATVVAMLVAVGDAWATQGPGIATGSASAAVQLTMAVVVYGSCGAIVAAGLIGLVRRR